MIFVGGYLSYGVGFLGDDLDALCDAASVDCSVSNIRFGVEGLFHFMPGEPVDVWAGLGLGYESLAVDFSGPGGDITLTFGGFELLHLQAGLDFQLSETAALGPFLGLAFAQYSSLSCDGDADCAYFDTTIDNKSVHEWFMIPSQAC